MAVLGSPEKRDPKTGSLIAYSPCHLIGKKIVHKLPV
jgi:hypothetical protein